MLRYFHLLVYIQLIIIISHAQSHSSNSNLTNTSASAATDSYQDFNTFEEIQDYNEAEPEDVHDIDELEAVLNGPLEGRRFVVVDKLGNTGRHIERPYTFKTSKRAKREKAEIQIGEDVKEELKKVPKGFNSTTVYIRYTHQLSHLEKLEDSTAKIGAPCRPTTILDSDYCERAAYPNKGKMVCNVIDNPAKGLDKNTCVCKFYRLHESEPRWKQITKHMIKLNDGVVDACLSPRNGECSHRISTGIKDRTGRFIFEVDVCQGHFQCDNVELSGQKTFTVTKHCGEEEFLSNFPSGKRGEVLLCAKPHPRRFNEYDEYKYYCLPKDNRSPDQEGFKAPPAVDEDEDGDEDDVLEG